MHLQSPANLEKMRIDAHAQAICQANLRKEKLDADLVAVLEGEDPELEGERSPSPVPGVPA